MRIEYQTVVERVDAAIDAAERGGRQLKRILLTSDERHELYQTGLVEKRDVRTRTAKMIRDGFRGVYRGVGIYAEETAALTARPLSPFYR